MKFRAFADQTRLRILRLLQEGDLCVNEIVEIIDVPQPTASRHLAYLRRAQLVESRREGAWTFYGLARPANAFHKTLLECLSNCFEEVADLRKDARRAAHVKKKSTCCRA